MDTSQLNVLFNQAYNEAVQRRHLFTTTEHLLFSMFELEEIKRLLVDLDVRVDFMKSQLERFFSQALEKAPDGCDPKKLAQPTDGLKMLISRTLLQALNSGREFPRYVDFLIQIAELKDSFASSLLKTVGLSQIHLMRWAAEHPVDNVDDADGDENEDEDIELDPDDAHDEDDSSEDDPDDVGDESAGPACSSVSFSRIKDYLSPLVEMARKGRIDPVIGRDRELDACCQALLRRNKCNVLIIGEAGVGKTAIVEGLARRIASKNVPSDLVNTEIYAIDVPSLMAGTKFRGEMESRLKKILKFIKKQKNAILFIDELHSAAGIDKSTGSQEILALLKPELAKGNIRLMGTTTYDDYRRVLASDTALIRRFHKLDIEEPDEETTKQILHEISGRYAEFHKVEYKPEALDEAVRLSGRFMPERRFPDKAIDVIDEAGAANRMKPLDEQLLSIDVPQIEGIISNIANIPDLHVSKEESCVLKNAEDRLKKVIFGQDSAIETLIRLVKLSRAGIRSHEKPVACLLFAGPTGVGKTEVAKQLAKVLEMPFVRFDMSEYREEYTVSKFIGSAPGYVGYDRGGLLTEAIRSKPNCVLLLDEIEKAHASIYDLLLQVMDVAKLTDNTGKTADFKHVILIMTSNAGSEEMSRVRIGFGAEIDVSQGMKDIEKTFSPEFRNRLDDIVMFNALSQASMEKIVDRMVSELEMRLAEKKITIELTQEGRAWLAVKGADPKFGARPMARLIEREISVPLAEEILFGAAKEGAHVVFELKDDKTGLCILKIEPDCHEK